MLQEDYTTLTVVHNEEEFEIEVKFCHFKCPGSRYAEAEDSYTVLSWSPEYDWLKESRLQNMLDKLVYARR